MNAPTGEQETGIRQTAHVAAGSPPRIPVGIEQRLLNRARILGLRRDDRLVIGFSGGRDSLALAGAMRWTERRLGVHAMLIHVDHGLRSSSADEARTAASLANSLGLPFELCRLTEPPRDVHRGVGLEEAARRERYRVLQGAAVRLGARAIVTAHHQQDQAETVLLHLLRGGGVHGACGMAEIGRVPMPGQSSHDISPEVTEIVLWRPLLFEPPSKIDSYVKHLDLTPVADGSNDDLTLRRNLIRHRALPVLEEAVPGAAAALARYAALAAEDDALLAALCDDVMPSMRGEDRGLDVQSVIDQPKAMQRRMVRRWLETTAVGTPVSMSRTEEVIMLAVRNVGGKSVEIGGGWTVQLTRGMLHAHWAHGEETELGENDA